MTPTAVFSWQAPRLLDRFSDTDVWNVRVAAWDHNSPEIPMLVPRWQGEPVVAAIVHSPGAFAEAIRRCSPSTRIVWLFHSGQAYGVNPSTVREFICCSNRVAALQQPRYPRAKAHVIAPWYPPAPCWRWKPGVVFSMLNHPNTRRPDRATSTAKIVAATADELESDLVWYEYGVGRKRGYLDESGRARLLCAVSAYVDVVPPWGGFGLAHHEMFAAGCPVVGSRWGDTAKEVSLDYSTLDDDLTVLPLRLAQVVDDESYAEQLSELGLEYITRFRTQAAMNEQIKKFLEYRP